MSALKPMVLHFHGMSPNPWKVAFVLQELGLPYELKAIDITKIKEEPFISLNPNGRVPALEDPNKGVVMWESGAIIHYLVEVYDTDFKLHYEQGPEKYATWCWEHFQMSGQGPYFGQKIWFERSHPERIQSAVERYANEMRRVVGVVDAHLKKQGTDFLVGDRVTYADIMFIQWFKGLELSAPEVDTTPFEHYTAWLARLMARPAISEVWADYKVHEAAGLAQMAAAKK